jgi:hypothetical protein
MHLDEVDGELCILDENCDIIHVFERVGPDGETVLSRAAYKHMCACVKEFWTPDMDPEVAWEKADAAWNALTPEHQMLLWSLSDEEIQNAQDICTGLLATLASYQGLAPVKRAFSNAIRGVLERFG